MHQAIFNGNEAKVGTGKTAGEMVDQKQVTQNL